MRRLGDARDELVQEDDLELFVVDVSLHVHLSNVGVICKVVGE